MRQTPPSQTLFVALAIAFPLTAFLLALFFKPEPADMLIHRGGNIAAYAGGDFVNMWLGAKLALAGQVDALFDFKRYNAALQSFLSPQIPFHNWSYPPHLLLMVWPLGLLPYLQALVLWQSATFAAFAWSAWPPRAMVGKGWYLAGLCLLPACAINLADGQNGFLLAALLIGGLRLADTRPWLAGCLIGLLTIKPQLGVILPVALLALGAWRVILAAAMTTLGLVVASSLAFGSEAWIGWLQVTLPYQSSLLEQNGVFYQVMMPSIFVAARLLGASMATATLSHCLVAALAIALMVLALRRPSEPLHRTAVVATAACLVSPYFFNYDMIAVGAALLLRLSMAETPPPLMLARFMPALLTPTLVMLLAFVLLPVTPLFLLAALIGLVAKAGQPKLA